MNDQIVKLFGFLLLLFALLVFFTSKWTVFDATALDDNSLNHLTAIRQAKIERGPIVADDGTVLARSVKAGGGTWRRTYPQGALFAQTIGYWRGSGDDAGLESAYAKDLEGTQEGISSVLGPLSSSTQIGDTVHATLDPKAQEVARTELAGRVGAVVALDPRTGAVLAMYSNPSYDPNAKTFDTTACRKDACLLNRATQGEFPPGSTFKVVTATAAIDSGRYTPTSEVDGSSPATISGTPLSNDAGDPAFGEVSLTYALTQSINTAWARVGVALGTRTMTDYMKRFGFYSVPPIDLPAGSVRASDVLSPTGSPFPAGSGDEDIGRIAIGQGGLAVTPLQMAMVASAVADDGKLMVPHLVSRVVNHDGQTVRTVTPRLDRRVMSATTAQDVNTMMRTVVDEGTGTPAKLGGVAFAGKTGTASVGATGAQRTDPWFIGFAPAGDPKVAVAVMLVDTDDQYGGQVAGPIAAAVVRTLLDEGK